MEALIYEKRLKEWGGKEGVEITVDIADRNQLQNHRGGSALCMGPSGGKRTN